jgi:hypothetical protein
MRRSFPTPPTALLCVFLFLPSPTTAAGEPDPDAQTLQDARLSGDGPALLGYLRKQIALAAQPDKIQALVRQLGDDEFAVRERASAELVALGRVALPVLDKARRDPDPEIAHRATNCVHQIEQGSIAALPAAVVRTVAKKKPAGAVAVLLDYLPLVENDALAEEVCHALAAVAVRGGTVDPALKAALADQLPVRRAAAAQALCQANPAAARPAVAALLTDPNAAVRLTAARALVALGEKKAVPVLIDLLGALPPEQAWPAEEVLLRLAGEHAPSVTLGKDAAARQKCHDAWAEWWKAHGAKTDLAKAREMANGLGYTLVVLLDRGIVMELDKQNHPRWQITGVQFPLDAQLLPGDRVLLAEQAGGRVTERDRKGNVVWEYKIDAPLMAQRLPNGNTFMANRMQLVEVDRGGKVVAHHALPGGSLVMRAQKLPNGDIACVNAANRFLRLDAKGKILNNFPVSVRTSGGRIDVLRNGHVLVPQMEDNTVIEYDASGRAVWKVAVGQPIAAVRLSNGNTLVTSMTELRAVEFDRNGKAVWEYRDQTRVTRALRR